MRPSFRPALVRSVAATAAVSALAGVSVGCVQVEAKRSVAPAGVEQPSEESDRPFAGAEGPGGEPDADPSEEAQATAGGHPGPNADGSGDQGADDGSAPESADSGGSGASQEREPAGERERRETGETPADDPSTLPVPPSPDGGGTAPGEPPGDPEPSGPPAEPPGEPDPGPGGDEPGPGDSGGEGDHGGTDH